MKNHNPQTPEGRTAIMKILMDAVEIPLCNLYARWQDEKLYEDINDYKNVLLPLVEKHLPGATIISFNKKFEIKLQVPNFPYQPIIRVKAKSIGWSSK